MLVLHQGQGGGDARGGAMRALTIPYWIKDKGRADARAGSVSWAASGWPGGRRLLRQGGPPCRRAGAGGRLPWTGRRSGERPREEAPSGKEPAPPLGAARKSIGVWRHSKEKRS